MYNKSYQVKQLKQEKRMKMNLRNERNEIERALMMFLRDDATFKKTTLLRNRRMSIKELTRNLVQLGDTFTAGGLGGYLEVQNVCCGKATN